MSLVAASTPTINAPLIARSRKNKVIMRASSSDGRLLALRESIAVARDGNTAYDESCLRARREITNEA